jgi:hypothetical protein
MLTARDRGDAERARTTRPSRCGPRTGPWESEWLVGCGLGDRPLFWHHKQLFDRYCLAVDWARMNSTLVESAYAEGHVHHLYTLRVTGPTDGATGFSRRWSTPASKSSSGTSRCT